MYHDSIPNFWNRKKYVKKFDYFFFIKRVLPNYGLIKCYQLILFFRIRHLIYNFVYQFICFKITF